MKCNQGNVALRLKLCGLFLLKVLGSKSKIRTLKLKNTEKNKNSQPQVEFSWFL